MLEKHAYNRINGGCISNSLSWKIVFNTRFQHELSLWDQMNSSYEIDNLLWYSFSCDRIGYQSYNLIALAPLSMSNARMPVDDTLPSRVIRSRTGTVRPYAGRCPNIFGFEWSTHRNHRLTTRSLGIPPLSVLRTRWCSCEYLHVAPYFARHAI